MSIPEQYGFIVFRQDWHGHRSGDPKPPITKTWFATRDEAEERKNRLRLEFPDNSAMVLCIAIAPGPGRTTKRRRR